PQLALGGAVLAAAVVLIVVRAQRSEDEAAPVVSNATKIEPVVIAPEHATPPAPVVEDDRDVSDVLAAAPARVTEDHAAVVRELLPLAQDARARWSDEARGEFD